MNNTMKKCLLECVLVYGYSQWQIQEFLKGGAVEGRGSGGCLEAPSGSSAKPPEADEFLHVKGVFSVI
jgi:hypothetical protein